MLFDYDDALDCDLNLFRNKDTVFFPAPVQAPDGTPSLAVLHRPMWDLDEVRLGQGRRPPAGVPDPRDSMWISFVALTDAQSDLTALTRWSQHRFLAGPVYDWEALKIGGGPAPVRVPDGWLLIHHGASGEYCRSAWRSSRR